MKAELEQRLEELKAEYESGQKILKDIENALKELETRKKDLEETLLRISGAVEVLDEVLGIPEDAAKAREATEASTGTGAEAAVGARVEKAEKERKGVAGIPETAETVEVPNVIRKSFENARQSLEAAGLQVGEVSEKSIFVAGIRFGNVIRQNPKPGTKVISGEVVDLVLAAKGRFKPVLSRDSKLNAYSTH